MIRLLAWIACIGMVGPAVAQVRVDRNVSDDPDYSIRWDDDLYEQGVYGWDADDFYARPRPPHLGTRYRYRPSRNYGAYGATGYDLSDPDLDYLYTAPLSPRERMRFIYEEPGPRGQTVPSWRTNDPGFEAWYRDTGAGGGAR